MPQDRAKRPETNSGSNPASLLGGLPPGGDAPESGGTYFLGRYRVVDEIGVGGMASVHLARMDGPGGFQKWVAIKKIHSHLVEDESFVQMFLDEARVAARISHPNVATVFDLGKHDTTYWIAMEYLHGEPLREVMRRTEELGTAMPPEIACRVIADAAEGLHAAHELLGKNGEKLNLVHRDVTPHNLFVTYDGVTKVVDFGIAKFSSRQGQTRAGTLKGKLAYMSPEQVQGESIDRRTDIFALGVVLWELTTGQRLFRMDSDIDTLARVQECIVPRPSTIVRGYPVDLEKIVMKMLAKNRNERYRTARELSRALQSLLMRRGLFIASDEVASYTQSIFTDRIQKREAHLRWASEVTQTINIDQLSAGLKSDISGAEPLPSASAIPRVAPAAGAPPPRPVAQPYARATPSEAFRPGHPRPAAGVPPESQGSLEPWMDNDAPTSHGVPMMEEPHHSTPPTLLAARRRQGLDDDTTGGVAILHDDELEEEDGETLVAVAADPGNITPLGTPAGGGGFQPMNYPTPIADHVPFGDPPSNFGAPPSTTGDVPYTEPGSFSRQGGYPGQAGHAGPLSQPGQPAQAHPGQPPQDPFGASAAYGAYPASPQTYGRRNGPPNRTADGRNNRTQLAQRFRRRQPMWMVAALSCSFALFLAGVGIAIWTEMGRKPKKTPSPAPIASVAGSSGPFTSARSAFTAWVAAAPPASTIVAPTTTPPPAPAPTTSATTGALAPTATEAPAAPPPAATAAPAAPTTVAATPAAPVAPPPAATTAARPSAAPTVTAQRAPQKAAQGELTVVCIPRCDQITDNGASLGPGHIFKRPTPAGRHVIGLSAPNGVKKTMTVEVFADKMTEIRLPMDKP